ncbi:MAG TPA: class I tRNA ligase family protein, partial [Vampirovibrionales bacterium]
MKELAKNYEPSSIENKLRKSWEEKEVFKVANPLESDFSIAFPPPNVTGELHMGHALNSTLQDILIRYNRMLGKKVHWQIGCDHAGIGTQIVVEKQLAKEGKTKYDLGRVEFEKKTWEWTEQHLGKIEEQMKLLGLSPDWSKSEFTLNEGYVQAVRKTFFELFKSGLVYKGTRLINWCPHCLTSLSDLEVVHEEQKGALYKIAYKLVKTFGELTELVVATSRPETLYGDVAVAINPDDERFKEIADSVKAGEAIWLELPLTDKKIPLILSNEVKTDFGTGALKITPAHDFNDNEIAKNWNDSEYVTDETKLEEVNIFNQKAELLPLDFIPLELHGEDRFKARKITLQKLEELEVLRGEDKYIQPLAKHDRCGNVIEPYHSPQWFISMKPLAKLAVNALKENQIRFYPERYSQTYLNWLENIQDWCISRQIWWGHKIPVYAKNVDVENHSSELAEQKHVELMNEFKRICKENGYALEVKGDKKRPSLIWARKQSNEIIFERGVDNASIVLLEEDLDFENELLNLNY